MISGKTPKKPKCSVSHSIHGHIMIMCDKKKGQCIRSFNRDNSIIIYILVACFFLANWAFANLNNFSQAWQLMATFQMQGASELALCALHGIKLSWTKECKSSSELQLTFSIWKFIAKLCKSFWLCPETRTLWYTTVAKCLLR